MRKYPILTFNDDGGVAKKDSILGGYLQLVHFEDKIIVFAVVTWGDEASVHRYIRVFGHQCSVITETDRGMRSVQVFPIDRESSKRDAQDEIGGLLRKHGLDDIALSFTDGELDGKTTDVTGVHPSELVPRRPTYQAPYTSPDGNSTHYGPGEYPFSNGYIS